MDFSELYYLYRNSPNHKALIGLCLEHGWGAVQNRAAALSLFLEGAKENDELSRLCLADFYMNYSDENGDKVKAFSIYLELAERNMNVVAAYRAAACFQLGVGVAKDLGLAWKYALSAVIFPRR